MITYDSNYFGFKQLLKLNGSAIYRTLIPSTVSTLILILYKYTFGHGDNALEIKLDYEREQLGLFGLFGSLYNDDDSSSSTSSSSSSSSSYGEGHPFVIAIYVMAFSLILNHRLNYCYQRYWEACGNLFLMKSKWMDSATILASFHYQSIVYKQSRPRSFGDDDNNNNNNNNNNDENNNNDNMDNNNNKSAPCGGNTRTADGPATALPLINPDYDHDNDVDVDTASWFSSTSSSSSSSSNSPSSHGVEASITSPFPSPSTSTSFVSHGTTRERRRSYPAMENLSNMKLSLRSAHSSSNKNNNHTSSSSSRMSSSVRANVGSERNTNHTNTNTNSGGVGILRRLFFWNNNNNNNNKNKNKNKNNKKDISNNSSATTTTPDKRNNEKKKNDNKESESESSSSSLFFLDGSSSDNKQDIHNQKKKTAPAAPATPTINNNNTNIMKLSSSMPTLSGGIGIGMGCDDDDNDNDEKKKNSDDSIRKSSSTSKRPIITTSRISTTNVAFADSVKKSISHSNKSHGSSNSSSSNRRSDDRDDRDRDSHTHGTHSTHGTHGSHTHTHNKHSHKHRRPSALLRNRRSQYDNQMQMQMQQSQNQDGGHHRRKPSTDIPTPNCAAVKSFKPNPSLEWQKHNRVAMPRNTGLHSTTVTQKFHSEIDLLLLQEENDRRKDERKRKQKKITQDLLKQQQQQHDLGGHHQGVGGGGVAVARRRASLPSMKFDFNKRSTFLLGGASSARINRDYDEKKIDNSDPFIENDDGTNNNDGTTRSSSNNNNINNSSNSNSNSNSNKFQRHSLFPMPELFDLPSLYKKLPPGYSVESTATSKSNNTNSNNDCGGKIGAGTGYVSGRDHLSDRPSNRSNLTSSSSSSSMMGSSHNTCSTNTNASNCNNGGHQQLQPPVENMNGRASLFLQEAAHLFSLMSAVSMASLRADMEGCASPLVDYVPGQKFPPVNPEEMKIKILVREGKTTTTTKVDKENASCSSLNIESEFDDNVNDTSNRDSSLRSAASSQVEQLDSTIIRIKRNNAVTNVFLSLFGMSRNARQRTIYNASRPFCVLGGVSNHEVEMLRKVRGHAAQHALCTFWLREFITREHLSGSTGNIAPPIMSRVYQYISDGSQEYHQCRKTAFTDFPFPHAQLTSFFVLISIFVFPFLCYTYVTNVWIAMALNFLTTSCFVGMQEVAMELEEPFIRYPNDLPLNNYQAQFNEALISSLYGGFHPDSWGHAHDNGGIFKMDCTSSDHSNDGGDNAVDGTGGDEGRSFGTIGNQSSTRSILKTSNHSIRNAEGTDNLVQFSIQE